MSTLVSEADPVSKAGASVLQRRQGKRRGWRILAAFWLLLLLAGGGGAGWLHHLGPPEPNASSALLFTAGVPPHPGAPGMTVVGPAPPPQPHGKPGTPIAAPIAALLEPAPDVGGVGLPRVAPGMKPPMQAYAGGYDATDQRPRIAFVLSGIGLSDPDSEDAVRQLPAGVTLAVSPYAARPEALLEKARPLGHEFLVSLPMEAKGFPLNDEGPHSLLTGVNAAENRQSLYWSLSRFAGYAGATNALDGMRGERFAASGEQMLQVMDDLSGRGLFFVEARPGEPPPGHIAGRSVDLVVDEPPVRSEIAAHLAQLEQIAREKGAALGLAGMPRPVTVDQLADWTSQLGAHGFALVPVSALLPTKTALR